MREIKFRAWGSIEYSDWKPEMQYSFDIVASDGEIFYGGDAQPDWILMQYTGLKDKNGKEIYEGDIVVDDYYPKPYVVEWDGELDLIDGTFKPEEWIVGFKLPGLFPKVIGNIYENHELLES